MSLDATRWAWQQTTRPTHKLVLLSLADRAGETHQCHPTIARLELDTGLYRETIMEALQQLEALNLICVNRRVGSKNTYQLIGVPDRLDGSVSQRKPIKNQSGKADQSAKPDQSGKADSTSREKPTTTSREKPTQNLSVESTKNLNNLALLDCCAVAQSTDEKSTGTTAHQKTSGPLKRGSQIPADFKPDDSITALADELGVSLFAELPRFADYHQAKGSVMKDWQAALRNWLRNSAKFAETKTKASAGKGKFDPLAYVNRSTSQGSNDAANAIDADCQRVA